MKVLLENEGNKVAEADVDDDNWVHAAIDAGWSWLRVYERGSVTVREVDDSKPARFGTRIATITLELHDE